MTWSSALSFVSPATPTVCSWSCGWSWSWTRWAAWVQYWCGRHASNWIQPSEWWALPIDLLAILFANDIVLCLAWWVLRASESFATSAWKPLPCPCFSTPLAPLTPEHLSTSFHSWGRYRGYPTAPLQSRASSSCISQPSGWATPSLPLVLLKWLIAYCLGLPDYSTASYSAGAFFAQRTRLHYAPKSKIE